MTEYFSKFWGAQNDKPNYFDGPRKNGFLKLFLKVDKEGLNLGSQ